MDPVNLVGPAITAAIPQVIGTVIPNPATGAPLLPCPIADPDDPCPRRVPGALALAFGIDPASVLPRNAVCVPAETPRGGACAFVPNVQRVYERPDALELVLSEWDEGEELLGYGEASPLFSVLEFGGACERDPIDVDLPGQSGYLGPVREDPFPTLPPPFGDTP
jgi:hypothetical protein